jgi:hypothetical protein
MKLALRYERLYNADRILKSLHIKLYPYILHDLHLLITHEAVSPYFTSSSYSYICGTLLQTVKVKLSLCLTMYHAMKTYWGVEV